MIRTGFTISWAGTFGYSLIAGLDMRFSPGVLLKYSFQFLANTVDYLTEPENKYGIRNSLFLDIKF
jgi:hypothetical protein